MKRKLLYDMEAERNYSLNFEEGNADIAGPEDAVVQPFTEFVVGRSSDCNLCVSSSYEKVSRKHLRFFLQNGEVRAQDLDSRHGTEQIRHSFRNPENQGHTLEQRLPSKNSLIEGNSSFPVMDGDEFLLAPNSDNPYVLIYHER